MRGSARWFWFVLALALHMPVAEAQERITSGEYSEWQCFYRIEPFGDQRADLRSGIVASTIAAVFGDPASGITPSDFMPFQGHESAAGTVRPASDEPAAPGSREETMGFLAAMGAKKASSKEGLPDD